jgi:hypothetical protein
MPDDQDFGTLIEYLQRIPAVRRPVSAGHFDDGGWWVKFSIDVSHKFAWHAVQELGHVLNYLSLNERLPTVFMPVSPPPYLNGGPAEYLSWAIECRDGEFKPGTVMKWLEGRLPRPVESEAEWARSDDG